MVRMVVMEVEAVTVVVVVKVVLNVTSEMVVVKVVHVMVVVKVVLVMVVVTVAVGITMVKATVTKLDATHQRDAMSHVCLGDGTPIFDHDYSFVVHILNCLREKHVDCRIDCSWSHYAILKWVLGATWKAISMTSVCRRNYCGRVTYDRFVCCGDSFLNCVSSTSTSNGI